MKPSLRRIRGKVKSSLPGSIRSMLLQRIPKLPGKMTSRSTEIEPQEKNLCLQQFAWKQTINFKQNLTG